MTMVLNILLDYLSGDLISDRPDKKSILPKLTTPQLLLDLRIFSENLRRRNTFENTHHLRNRISGRKIQKKMHMIRSNFHLFNLKRELIGNAFEQLSHSLSNICSLDPLAIFRCPHQMVSGVINSMTGSFDRHARNLNTQRPPFVGQNFSSPPKGRGFQVLSQ